ncbi:MAG: hypothetical protein NTY19_26050 [Planctomycetota bacterium]|nr:hypothetical protein [Planctomycetota bacterium]
MELRHEQAELAIQRVFGSGASLGGSIGSRRYPGVLTIKVDGIPWGSCRTMQEAIGDASRKASALATRMITVAAVLTLLVLCGCLPERLPPLTLAPRAEVRAVSSTEGPETPAANPGMCRVHREFIEATDRKIAALEYLLLGLRACKGLVTQASRSCCNRLGA